MNINKIQNNAPSFTGIKSNVLEKVGKAAYNAPEKLIKNIDYTKISPTLPLMSLICYGFVITPRLFKANARANENARETGQPKKFDEFREIFTRDFITVSSILFAVPTLDKIGSALAEKKSKFVLMGRNREDGNSLKKVLEFLNPFNENTKTKSLDELTEIYGDIDSKKSMSNFCDFIDEGEGHIGAIFNKLDDTVKETVQKMFEKNGGEGDFFKAENGAIKKAFEGAFDNNDETLETIINALKINANKVADEGKGFLNKLFKMKINQQNNLIKNAKGFNSIAPAAATLLIVPAFLGFLLPKLNEKITKKKYAEHRGTNVNNVVTNPTKNINFNNAENVNLKKEQVFANFMNS